MVAKHEIAVRVRRRLAVGEGRIESDAWAAGPETVDARSSSGNLDMQMNVARLTCYLSVCGSGRISKAEGAHGRGGGSQGKEEDGRERLRGGEARRRDMT